MKNQLVNNKRRDYSVIGVFSDNKLAYLHKRKLNIECYLDESSEDTFEIHKRPIGDNESFDGSIFVVYYEFLEIDYFLTITNNSNKAIIEIENHINRVDKIIHNPNYMPYIYKYHTSVFRLNEYEPF